MRNKKKYMRIKELEKDIFKRIGKSALFEFHIRRTVHYANKLAKYYHVNVEESVAGALLHDIDGIVANTKNDFANSQKIAEKILRAHGYSHEFISKMQGIILTHSAGSKIKPRTKLEQVVANADALSHFEMLPLYFYVRGMKQLHFKETLKEVKIKLECSEKKLTLYEAKRIGRSLKRNADKQLEFYKD